MKIVKFNIIGEARVCTAVCWLVVRSCYFVVEPLPEDVRQFSIKPEQETSFQHWLEGWQDSNGWEKVPVEDPKVAAFQDSYLIDMPLLHPRVRVNLYRMGVKTGRELLRLSERAILNNVLFEAADMPNLQSVMMQVGVSFRHSRSS